MGRWNVIVLLAAAQFVMVLDSTVMNVSLSDVVEDLDSNVADLQTAITLYTLTMAAFMLTGGRLGDVLGRRRAFRIGIVIYAIGSLITALSPNVATLIVGWSVIEGLGAVLVIPAIVALNAANYSGRDRAVAYGVLGGIAAAGAAVGPLIGGVMGEVASWRWVFGGETVLMLVLLAFTGKIRDAPVGHRTRLDPLSVVLSSSGLGLFVFGLLKTSEWGWLTASGGPRIGGTQIEPFGVSMSLVLELVGVATIAWFLRRQRMLEQGARDPLLPLSVLRVPQLRAGLTMLAIQMIVLAGVFFVIPVYLQVVMGNDALESGLKLLPLSLGVMALAVVGARLATRFAPRVIVRAGLVAMVVGIVGLLASVTRQLDGAAFQASLGMLGVGLGLNASQLGNTIMSSVETARSSVAGGLQGTAQNLGSSLGTAVIGSALLTALTLGFQGNIVASPDLTAQQRAAITQQASAGVPIVSEQQARDALARTGLSVAVQDEVAVGYVDAQIRALRVALILALVLALGGLAAAARLPGEPLARAPDPAPA